MMYFTFFNGFLDPIFGPLLNYLGTFGFVMFISFAVSIITIFVYKYTTDQTLMKSLKETVDKLNKEAKKHMHDQKKAMSIQKEMFEKQMVIMKHSFTSTLITMLPILILLSWLNAHVAYAPIEVNQQFTVTVDFDKYVGNVDLVVPDGLTSAGSVSKNVTGSADWTLYGPKGDYVLEWKINGKSYQKDVSIGSGKYTDAVKLVNDGVVKQIKIDYDTEKVLNLFGWKLGWLGSYIIFAILFSTILRKLLKVY